MKHLDLWFYWLRDVVDNGLIDVLHIPKTQQPADGTLVELGGCQGQRGVLKVCDHFDLPLISLFLFFPYFISPLILSLILLSFQTLFHVLSNCSHAEHMFSIASTWLLRGFRYFIPVFWFSIIPVHVIVVLG
jgi:hypothetical protein